MDEVRQDPGLKRWKERRVSLWRAQPNRAQLQERGGVQGE